MICPQCSAPAVRAGKIRGKQRWQCKGAAKHLFVENALPVGRPVNAGLDNPLCPYCEGRSHLQQTVMGVSWGREVVTARRYRCVGCGRGFTVDE